jgi:hypothetical protein
MKAKYNSHSHEDMRIVGKGTYDGMNTWLHSVRSLMKQPPWGEVKVGEATLAEIKQAGNLVQINPTRSSNVLEIFDLLPILINRIDDCIHEQRNKSPNLSSTDQNIFCRTNECSMKASSGHQVYPFSSGSGIVERLLLDHRTTSWSNTPSTTIYLSDFDPSFNINNEYRVFIWQGKVTGISQYRWFEDKYTEYHTRESAKHVCKAIVQFVEGSDGLVSKLRRYEEAQLKRSKA